MPCDHIYKLDDHTYEDADGYRFPCQKCTEVLILHEHCWDDVLEAFGFDPYDED